MTRWLDALGPLKWPSLLLVASPLVAYPFWLPEPAPAVGCGLVDVGGRIFTAYRAGPESYILRPTRIGSTAAPSLHLRQPPGFDAGGMVVERADMGPVRLTCLDNSSAAAS